AINEPRVLFDPFVLDTKARESGEGFTLDGVKSLVPRAKDAELFIVAADLDGKGPALFIVEAKSAGIKIEAEPAMGLRAASTSRVRFENVALPKTALIADGDLAVYT